MWEEAHSVTGDFTRQFGEGGGRVPQSWVGEDVLVLLDPEAKVGLLPPQPGQELTVRLTDVNSEGALFTHRFSDPNTGGTERVGDVFYPWGSIRRIRSIEMP
jgi:hypothetical protein